MPDMSAWAAFLGKTTHAKKARKMKGSRDYDEAEYEWEEARQVKVSDTEGWGRLEWKAQRPEWAWSLMETPETGPRRSWMSGRVLSDGECMIHIEGNWSRGIHISEVPAEAWHQILGQPYGGDGRILGQMKARWTREAKKDLKT